MNIYTVLSFIITLILVPIVIKLRIMDRPNYRSIHSKVTPKAGGLAILVGALIGWLILGNTLGICILAGGATLLGLYDDTRELSPKTKMLGQLLLGVGTVYFGASFHLVGGIADMILSVVWIISFMNAFNLIDGMDGLAAGVALINVIIFLSLGILGLSQILWPVAGAILAFLIYNFRPAKIFMGDTGSMLLGYILALGSIIVQNHVQEPVVGGIAVLVALGYPVIDTVLSIVRRKINRKPIFAPDRSHSYNLLVDKLGMGYLSTVFTIYSITLILGLLAKIVISFDSLALGVGTLLGIIAVTSATVYRLGLLAESNYEKHKS